MSAPQEDQPGGFHGILQHSFALSMPPRMGTRYTDATDGDPFSLLVALFEQGGEQAGFRLSPVGDLGAGGADPGGYSLIVKRQLMAFSAEPLAFAEGERSADGRLDYPLPAPFAWADRGGANTVDLSGAWDGFITQGDHEDTHPANDYLVTRGEFKASESTNPCAVSWLLLQLLAHRRSRLFGPKLARRIFNVMLPYALLEPVDGAVPGRPWLVQPTFSLFSMPDRREFRRLFSFTVFMVPVEVTPATDGAVHRDVGDRALATSEIAAATRGWAVAVSPPVEAQASFTVSGPLPSYLAATSPRGLADLGLAPSTPAETLCTQGRDGSWAPAALTTRQVTEAIAFTHALRLVAGPGRTLETPACRHIGERVLTSLSASRVSSLVVLDETPRLSAPRPGVFGEAMQKVMSAVADDVRLYGPDEWSYRIDRPFYDEDGYEISVMPGQRCVIVTTFSDRQHRFRESGLLQAGWIAYMVIGTATAGGMIRALYHDIEEANDPTKIADVEHEIVVDLHEIYDLDITGEMYKHRYRLLRGLLGVDDDYTALRNKLHALHDETMTKFERGAQQRLEYLTLAIVLLSVLILAFTIVVAAK
jgi:hypothetical protein